MFDQFRQQRPITYWVLVIGGGLILVWAVLSRLAGGGGGSASQTTTATTLTGPSDAQIAASASLEIARLQATADAAARADATMLAEETLGVQYKIAELDNARGMNADNLNYHLGIRQLEAQTTQVGIAADLQQALGLYEAQTDQLQIAANRDMSLAQTDAQVRIGAQNASVQKKKSSNGILGGIVSGIFGLFSDERLKCEIRHEFVDHETGLNWYSFEHTPEARRMFGLPAGRRIGVLAQELLDTKWASAVSRDHTGYLRVNYGAINGVKHGRLALA
jgi:hypothetical protein